MEENNRIKLDRKIESFRKRELKEIQDLNKFEIDIKNYLGTFRILIPKNLNSKISVMTSILKFFRIGDGQLGIFNNYENISN